MIFGDIKGVVAGFPDPFPDTPVLLLVPLCVCLLGHLRVRLYSCMHACVRACRSVGRSLRRVNDIAPVRLLRALPVCACAKDNELLLIRRLTCATC